jgi:hypothetical protein
VSVLEAGHGKSRPPDRRVTWVPRQDLSIICSSNPIPWRAVYAEIIAPDVLIVGVLLLGFVLPIWAAIDAAVRPEWAFEQAGTNKTLWIVLPVVGIFACGLLGFVSAIVWFASFRGRVIAAAAGGTPIG